VTQLEAWDPVVVDADAPDHIVQLYQDEEFLNRAVCRFVGAGLVNGEGIILVPTLPHWSAIRGRLESDGVSVEAARSRGQLTIVDADECLTRFMRDAMPDPPVFNGVFGTSSYKRALKGATRKCACGGRWSTSCGSAETPPPA
jgi:hypothetical protein